MLSKTVYFFLRHLNSVIIFISSKNSSNKLIFLHNIRSDKPQCSYKFKIFWLFFSKNLKLEL